MADKRQVEFFVLRYVPNAVKEEFVNVGVVMVEAGTSSTGFAGVRFARNWRRARCLDPDIDVEVLEALAREMRGQLVSTQEREKLMLKLQDSFSNVLQLSPVKRSFVENPAKELDLAASLYLEAPKGPTLRVASGRQQILQVMEGAFEQAGVWDLLMHGIPVAPYTKPGDPLKFDYGYRIGSTIKIFHAVSLKNSVEQAVMLSSRYPAIADKMAHALKAHPFLTTVADDNLDRQNEQVQFALGMVKEAQIKIVTAAEMPAIAEVAKVELQV